MLPLPSSLVSTQYYVEVDLYYISLTLMIFQKLSILFLKIVKYKLTSDFRTFCASI